MRLTQNVSVGFNFVADLEVDVLDNVSEEDLALWDLSKGSIVLGKKKFTFGRDKATQSTTEVLQSVQLIYRNFGMCFCKTNKAKKIATYVIPPTFGIIVLTFVGLVVWIVKISG